MNMEEKEDKDLGIIGKKLIFGASLLVFLTIVIEGLSYFYATIV
jgi:hypothetical protein